MIGRDGFIIYESLLPINRKPEIFSTGGYAVKVGQSNICFDWQAHTANASILPDGRIRIECRLKNFDRELFLDANGFYIGDAEDLTRGDLTEVFYECYDTEDDLEKGVLISLQVVHFSIGEARFKSIHKIRKGGEFSSS